ncbi:class B sortase [Alkalihalobacterium bogoriense]|uniref:class B sortase n=1 Tax=Alkalihalobacterium bogoriense TaxID=246272 RepID=UPI00047DCBDB|nr:class B sortase [Alkalihalobacterium bogoriense]
MDEKRKKTKAMHRLGTLLFLSILLFSSYKLGMTFWDYYKNRQVMAEAQDVYYEATIVEEDSDGIRSQFGPLLEINKDIVGWITVDGTVIDYPIVRAVDNEYYLNRSFKHEETRAGSIFMDYRNNVEMNNRNIILYGHRMRDGSMFTQLNQYLEEDFFYSHPIFYFDTLYKGYDVEVFSAYLTTTDFYYIETDFQSDADYQTFIERLKEKSLFESDVTIEETDQIITLSTCDYTLDRDTGRLVVHGKLKERSSVQ